MKTLMQHQKIKKLLKEVEVCLEEMVEFDDVFLREAALFNMQAGGKRLRPLFVLLSAQYFGVHNKDIVKFATIMELVHMASLIHDDVNDHSSLRRGQKTLNVKYNNNVAVHSGDYILIEALKKVYEIPHSDILLQILSETAIEMSKGEIAQLASLFDIHQNIESYNYRIERKTALLIAVCCKTGAILSNASNDEIDAFYKYGFHLGMAFQIKDDLMDIQGTNIQLGKPNGNDLKNGLVNLPTILLLEKDFPEKVEIQERIKNQFPNGQDDIDFIRPFIQAPEIISACEDIIYQHINAAKEILNDFRANDTRNLLFEASDYIYERLK